MATIKIKEELLPTKPTNFKNSFISSQQVRTGVHVHQLIESKGLSRTTIFPPHKTLQ